MCGSESSLFVKTLVFVLLCILPMTLLNSSFSSEQQQAAVPPKKKRNLPGMPDPDAEVIALSPKTLLATNRFVCEICSKGFQRDQNLQLHRRGHNLPWKLRQRNGKEVRKRVYVCPEIGCIHHDPSRALGDLTGIKKHFCRKHGEKKWKCDKCSKKYAVQSDWKAHAKTCGTREYRCDCGTVFSRRDSFITHRAFCDALAEDGVRTQTSSNLNEEKAHNTQIMPPPAVDQQDFPEITAALLHYFPAAPVNSSNSSGTTAATAGGSSTSGTTSTTSVFANLFASSAPASQTTSFSDLICAMSRNGGTAAAAEEPPSLCLASNGPASFLSPAPDRRQIAPPAPSAHMSATALLQKAAQMGASASSFSFLHGFGLAASSAAAGSGHHASISEIGDDSDPKWRLQPLQEPTLMSGGLGPGPNFDSGCAASGLPVMMLDSASLFSSKPATLDFLGLGMGPALLTTIGGRGRVNVCPAPLAGAYSGASSPPAEAWDGPGNSIGNL